MSQLKAESVYQSFVPIAKYWLKELEYYGKHQFKNKVGQHPWTIGQLYDYLMNGVMEYHFEAIRSCIARRHGNSGGEKKMLGKWVMMTGRYLPVKFKSGEYSPYVPQQPESTEKMQDLMFRFLKEMQKIAKEIDQANVSDYTYPHPKFGALTALEWYQVIMMEYQYFMRYKRKLDKEIRSFNKVDESDEYIDA